MHEGDFGGFVDYVEDGTEQEVIVESHCAQKNIATKALWVDGKPAWGEGLRVWVDQADSLWEELTERMLAGDPPDPERG